MRKHASIALLALILIPLTGCGYGTVITLTPCVTEDSDNCYWDAVLNGNGEGTSFVTIDGVTYYPEGR